MNSGVCMQGLGRTLIKKKKVSNSQKPETRSDEEIPSSLGYIRTSMILSGSVFKMDVQMNVEAVMWCLKKCDQCPVFFQ